MFVAIHELSHVTLWDLDIVYPKFCNAQVLASVLAMEQDIC